MIRVMTHDECIEVIADQRLARLACAKDNIPYVVPIYYASFRDRLYAFSMPGKKLEFLRSNPRACLQIDQYHDAHQWRSVVVNATFQELPDDGPNHQERLQAWSLLERHLEWWEPGALKPQPQSVRASSAHVFFALDIVEVSGIEAREGEPVSIS